MEFKSYISHIETSIFLNYSSIEELLHLYNSLYSSKNTLIISKTLALFSHKITDILKKCKNKDNNNITPINNNNNYNSNNNKKICSLNIIRSKLSDVKKWENDVNIIMIKLVLIKYKLRITKLVKMFNRWKDNIEIIQRINELNENYYQKRKKQEQEQEQEKKQEKEIQVEDIEDIDHNKEKNNYFESDNDNDDNNIDNNDDDNYELNSNLKQTIKNSTGSYLNLHQSKSPSRYSLIHQNNPTHLPSLPLQSLPGSSNTSIVRSSSEASITSDIQINNKFNDFNDENEEDEEDNLFSETHSEVNSETHSENISQDSVSLDISIGPLHTSSPNEQISLLNTPPRVQSNSLSSSSPSPSSSSYLASYLASPLAHQKQSNIILHNYNNSEDENEDEDEDRSDENNSNVSDYEINGEKYQIIKKTINLKIEDESSDCNEQNEDNVDVNDVDIDVDDEQQEREESNANKYEQENNHDHLTDFHKNDDKKYEDENINNSDDDNDNDNGVIDDVIFQKNLIGQVNSDIESSNKIFPSNLPQNTLLYEQQQKYLKLNENTTSSSIIEDKNNLKIQKSTNQMLSSSKNSDLIHDTNITQLQNVTTNSSRRNSLHTPKSILKTTTPSTNSTRRSSTTSISPTFQQTKKNLSSTSLINNNSKVSPNFHQSPIEQSRSYYPPPQDTAIEVNWDDFDSNPSSERNSPIYNTTNSLSSDNFEKESKQNLINRTPTSNIIEDNKDQSEYSLEGVMEYLSLPTQRNVSSLKTPPSSSIL